MLFRSCHSNHRVEATSDALVGTGDKSFCVSCHVEGDPGWTAAQQMHARLTDLDGNLQQVAALLSRAERAGMEVSAARLTESNAREQLIKARVDVHAFDPQRVDRGVAAGQKLAAQARRAGEAALAELAFRRKGLGLSLVAIAFVVLSLWLLIRYLERPQE